MKVVDCFMFHNESDMLFYRLSVLQHVVDLFVIIESRKTHRGTEKELTFDMKRYEFFEDKIHYYVLDDLPIDSSDIQAEENSKAWINERAHRDYISNVITHLNLSNNDIVLISDVDEIPSPHLLKCIRDDPDLIDHDKLYALIMIFFLYKLECIRLDPWCHAKLMTYEYFISCNKTPSDLRLTFQCEYLPHAGYHLSYFMNPERIRQKLLDFSHAEYSTDQYTNTDIIQFRIDNHQDIAGRGNIQYTSTSFDISKADQRILPPRVSLLKKLNLVKT